MANLPPLVAELVAKTDGFQAQLTRASQVAEQSAQRMNAAFDKISVGLASVGVGLSVGAFTGFIKGVLDTGDELNKLAQKTGITVERLSELKFAAELGGIDNATLGKGLKEFNKSLVEASDSSSKAAAVFKALGVDITAGPDKAFRQFAESFSRLPEGELRAAAATEVLKKAGFDLIPVLQGGAKGLDEAATQAQKLGIVMSGKLAEQAERFNDNLTRLSKGSTALGISLTGHLLPPLATLTDNIVEATLKGEKWLGVLKEAAKIITATSSLIPGYIGRAADLQAQRLFANNGSRLSVGKIGGLDDPKKDPDAEARKKMEEALRRALAGNTGGRVVKAGEDTAKMAALQWKQVGEVIDAEQQQLIDEGKEYLDQVQKDNEESAKAVAEQWRQVYAEIDAEQERAIEDGRQYLASLADDTKEATNFAREMGLTFSSAFEDAVVGGKKFQDVLQGLIADLARIVTRKTITEPLGDAVSGLFKDILPGSAQQLSGPTGGGFWDSLTSWLPKFATGTPYVPQDMVAMVHKGERIIPAAENRAGAGGGVTIVQHINIDSRSDQASIRQAMLVAKEEAKAEIMDSRMRGGAFA